MEQHEICSTDDLHLMLREHWHGNFLYRGENSTSYSLRPKYGRIERDDKRNYNEVEKLTLTEFKRRAVQMIQHVPENDWEWLALAQHFGLATRLLDWTENPLIAAYFATKWQLPPSDRVLYVLDETEFEDANLDVSPFDIKDVLLYRPKHISNRISAQGGVFTVHPSPFKPFVDSRVEKWIIREGCATDINLTLETYGINEAFVFQDLEGLARYLNAWYIGIV